MVELSVQGRLYAVVWSGTLEYPSVFRGVAHFFHPESAVAVQNGGASADVIGGVGGFRVEVLPVGGFVYNGFARQAGFVNL